MILPNDKPEGAQSSLRRRVTLQSVGMAGPECRRTASVGTEPSGLANGASAF